MSSPTDAARLRAVDQREHPVGEIEPREPVGDHVGQEMQRAVEEGKEPGHPPEADRRIPAGELPQRRDRERDADEAQRPDAGFVGEIAQRVGAEISRQRRPDEPAERPEAREKHDGLEDPANDTVRDLQVVQPPVPTVVILLEIHPRVEAGHLIAVAVEHQRLAAQELADPAFGGLGPARMVDRRVHVRVEAVFLRRRFLPRVERLLLGELDLDDRLDVLEAVLPGHGQPQRRAVLVRAPLRRTARR